jgi:hypothetical protein
MGKVTSSTLIALLVLAGLSSCRAEEAPVSVVSLRENLSDLEDAARPWSPDAYLANAELPIHYGSPGPWLVSAGFNSTTEQFQSLLVFLREDGTVDTEIIPHTVPVVQVVPIEASDWEVDSQEALDIALDEEGMRFLEKHPGAGCSSLTLVRIGLESGSPVVWRLVLSDCLDPWVGQTTEIDAITGEVISRKMHSPPAP